MAETTYEVKGMTCDHCVRAVTEEIKAVEGVTSVDVSLADGQAVVTGEADPEAVRAAVLQAGYVVTAVRS